MNILHLKDYYEWWKLEELHKDLTIMRLTTEGVERSTRIDFLATVNSIYAHAPTVFLEEYEGKLGFSYRVRPSINIQFFLKMFHNSELFSPIFIQNSINDLWKRKIWIIYEQKII